MKYDGREVGRALALLRSVRGFNQAALARAARVNPSAISDYERGKRVPRLRTLERLVFAMGFELGAVEESHEYLARLHLNHSFGSLSDRDAVPALWERLKRYPVKMQHTLVREAREFRNWALVEFLCLESTSVAASDTARALELAELACSIAEQFPAGNPWTFRLRGYAAAHLGNARRAGGDLKGAEDAFARAEELWKRGKGAPAYPLEEARLLGMKAALRTAERRLPEALGLLDQALALPEGQALRGVHLVSKGRTLAALGELDLAIAHLKEATPHVDERADPRLALCLVHNLADYLSKAGRFEEAEVLLPEVERLAAADGGELDVLRLRWVAGRTAAGLGDGERAIFLLDCVRREFTARGILYDVALVSLELAVVYLEAGRTREVKALARHMVPIFSANEMPKEALAALAVFRRAAEAETLSVELARQVSARLEKARGGVER